MTHEKYVALVEQVKSKELELSVLKAIHPADMWERDLDTFIDAWSKYESNMKILDDCGVGGSAFRKPTMPPKGPVNGNAGSNIVAKTSHSSNQEAFKRLQKLSPFSPSTIPISPLQNRREIILPIVKNDPIVPVKEEKPKKSDTNEIAKTNDELSDVKPSQMRPSTTPIEHKLPAFPFISIVDDDSDKEFGVGQSTAVTVKRNNQHLSTKAAAEDEVLLYQPIAKKPLT